MMEFGPRPFRFGCTLCAVTEIEPTNVQHILASSNCENALHDQLSHRAKKIFNLLAFKRKLT